jgi:hypothetical protein
MAEMKTKPHDADVEQFLQTVEDPQRRVDCQTLLVLMERATGFKPKMWGEGMVGFGAYHYRYESGREGDWFLTGFSPRKQNLTVYITPGFEPYPELMQSLGKYKTGRSCLYVKRLADVDLPTLEALVRRSTADMAATYPSEASGEEAAS